jgi:Skp family chaperone for outer membrane proteins
MRIPVIAAVAVVSCVGLLAVSQISAQRNGITAPPPNGVALVNMTSITQNSVRVNKAMDALKKEYLAKGEELKKEGERGQQLTEEVRKLPPGTPERKELEQKLLKMRADFELHGKKVTNDTRDGETKVMYSLTRELRDELARYAQANGVQLMLRYDPTPEEMTDPRVVLQEIQKPIVYQRGAEITPAILESMNHRAQAAGPATSRAPQPAKGATR